MKMSYATLVGFGGAPLYAYDVSISWHLGFLILTRHDIPGTTHGILQFGGVRRDYNTG